MLLVLLSFLIVFSRLFTKPLDMISLPSGVYAGLPELVSSRPATYTGPLLVPREPVIRVMFRRVVLPNFEDFVLYKGRSRLYRSQILQENMRLTAFFKLYKICVLLHRCNLNILATNRFEKSAISLKIQNSAKRLQMSQNLQYHSCQISKISA